MSPSVAERLERSRRVLSPPRGRSRLTVWAWIVADVTAIAACVVVLATALT